MLYLRSKRKVLYNVYKKYLSFGQYSKTMYNLIPGQDKEKALVQKMIANNRLPHAIMLLGDTGFGGLAMALSMASHILCTDPRESGVCGTCKACQKSLKYIHPDIHFSFPVIKKGEKKREDTTSNDFLKEWRAALDNNAYMNISDWASALEADNKQVNINTKECNEIIQKLSLKSFESEFKVLIIWLPEYLGKESNRLLKLIEEPPPNTKIIMIVEDAEKILATIQSRCQLIKLGPVTDQVLNNHVISQGIQSTDQLDNMINLAEGNYGYLQKLLNHKEQNFSNSILNWLRMAYMVEKEPEKIIQWINTFSQQSKDSQKSFFSYGLHFFREYLLNLLSDGYRMRLSSSEIEVANKMKKILTYDKLEYIINELDSLVTLLDRNASIKLAMLSSSITIGELMKNKKHENLVA